MSGLKPMTKKNELKPSGKPSGKPSPKKGGVKLGLSVKTTAVETMQGNFVTWDDMKEGQSIVFELEHGEFKQTVNEKNKNWKFENFYTWKAVVVDADEEVVKVIEAKDADNLIQIPCQQSHRQGIKDLIEMGDTVGLYRGLSINTKDGTTYYNCEVASLELENLDAYEA